MYKSQSNDNTRAPVRRPFDKNDKGPRRVAGTVIRKNGRFWMRPANRKMHEDFRLNQGDLKGAQENDVILCLISQDMQKAKQAHVVRVIGHKDDPAVLGQIAIAEHGLRATFGAAVLAETEGMKVPELAQREDLRALPLVTIDGADARDFDDAVLAEKIPGGYHLVVAIADVSHYVRPGSALDREALLRGNSTYLPEHVLPMLPEALSNDLCSLRPHEDRACMAVHMYLDKNFNLQTDKTRVTTALMKSVARLTYEQVQDARDGNPDAVTAALMDTVIAPLYGVYEGLWHTREQRGALDINIPERKIVVNENFEMTGVAPRERLDSHKLIEEFMILANIATATILENLDQPCVYRVHGEPDPVRMGTVRAFATAMGLKAPSGEIRHPVQLNDLLHDARGHVQADMLNEIMLRAQKKAHYSTDNKGHFGLALGQYAHFTSPIRRYADLLVHRIFRGLLTGENGLPPAQAQSLEEMAVAISQTERESAEAERDSVARYAAAYHQRDVGKTFEVTIQGLANAGLFATLPHTKVDVFVPARTLPADEYRHVDTALALVGEETGLAFKIGEKIRVRLRTADPIKGSLSADFISASTEESVGDKYGLGDHDPCAHTRDRHKYGHGAAAYARYRR